ncbi:MAG: aminotransferase class V-fold PLP-dependent enzyme [Pirellula sp.]|nr:aminotransferase class V-fold PLP-dependent enzyme [Pirellula sp.]
MERSGAFPQVLIYRGMSSQEKPSSTTADAISASLMELLADGAWRAYEGVHSERLKVWLSQSLGVEHVRLCCSGTFAVELALRGLKISSEDEVILSAYDFPGNFRSVDDIGAQVVLCDPPVDRGWVLTPEALESVVSPKCKGLIVSHLHGQLAPMKQIMEWARSSGIKVVEDACQAHGAVVDGKPVGSWGDVGVFSYGGSKLVSSGRGGSVVTNDPLVAQRMTIFCDRGNNAFPLSEIQAALVLAQYESLDKDHQSRLQFARNLVERLKPFPWLHVPFDMHDDSPAFYKLGFMVKGAGAESDMEAHGSLRSKVLDGFLNHGIEAGEGFRGFASRSPKRYRVPKPLEQCQTLAATTILLHHSMLLNPRTGADAMDRVIEAVKHINQELQL